MAEPNELLRIYLGEVIPEGGSDEDTMFTDAEIQGFLEQFETTEAAAALGWKSKAANLAHLVDMAEGSSRRQLNQRFKNAMDMLKYYEDLAGVGIGSGKPTRIHQIERS